MPVVDVGVNRLEEQLSKFPAQLLDRPCAESHLGKLVQCLTSDTMVLLATDLGLSDVEVEDIREIYPRNPPKQRLKMFKVWLQKNQSQAMYRWVMIQLCVIKLCAYGGGGGGYEFGGLE